LFRFKFGCDFSFQNGCNQPGGLKSEDLKNQRLVAISKTSSYPDIFFNPFFGRRMKMIQDKSKYIINACTTMCHGRG
jgi:hypothetical protein